jgi:hypothetical protein
MLNDSGIAGAGTSVAISAGREAQWANATRDARHLGQHHGKPRKVSEHGLLH